MKAPTELGLSPDVVLKVVKPLYGIPEIGFHWYMKHVWRLGMERSSVDPCLLMRKENGKKIVMIMLQVDDTLEIGTK